MQRDLTLSSFDNHLMNGLEFCKKVYRFFEQIRKSPGGVQKLRVRGRSEKKLVEELIPLAWYVQARSTPGRLLRVRWILGSQPYDAIMLSSGAVAEHGVVPKRQHIEITTVVHKNEHLLQSLINAQGYAFGVIGVSRDPKSKITISRPYVYDHREAEDKLTLQILATIKAKSAKAYPVGTVLVIRCVPEILILQDGWEYVVQQVQKADLQHGFCEIFLYESLYRYSATLRASDSQQTS